MISGGYFLVCDFDNVSVDQRIRTVIKDIDIERGILELYEHDEHVIADIVYKDELIMERIIKDDILDCSLQVLYLNTCIETKHLYCTLSLYM